MRLFFLAAVLQLASLFSLAQVTVVSTIVPKYIQGVNGTNNQRMPFVFHASFSGMLPNSYYRYFTSLDTFGSFNNGGGNAWLLNKQTKTVRRSTTSTLNNPVGYDSLLTDVNGNYSGWFMVEATGNARFVPGKKVYAMISLNDGMGGIAATRYRLEDDSIRVVNFGSAAGDTSQCSAFYDSTAVPAKSFVLLFDNLTGNGRPVAGAIVEDDGQSVNAISTFSTTYKTYADDRPGWWCTLLPNASQGIRRIEYRDWYTNEILSYLTDSDAVWCSGVNTVLPAFDHNGVFLNSLSGLPGHIVLPQTLFTYITYSFSVNGNFASADWNMGDGTNLSGDTVNHFYTQNGWYSVTSTVSNGACSIWLSDSVFVDLQIGIDHPEKVGDLIIFPNPSSDVVRIQSDADVRVVFRDLLGSEIDVERLSVDSFNIRQLPSGVYLVYLIDSSNRSSRVVKLIKN